MDFTEYEVTWNRSDGDNLQRRSFYSKEDAVVFAHRMESQPYVGDVRASNVKLFAITKQRHDITEAIHLGYTWEPLPEGHRLLELGFTHHWVKAD